MYNVMQQNGCFPLLVRISGLFAILPVIIPSFPPFLSSFLPFLSLSLRYCSLPFPSFPFLPSFGVFWVGFLSRTNRTSRTSRTNGTSRTNKIGLYLRFNQLLYLFGTLVLVYMFGSFWGKKKGLLCPLSGLVVLLWDDGVYYPPYPMLKPCFEGVQF